MPHELQHILDTQFSDLDNKYRRNTRDIRKVMNRLPPEEIETLKLTTPTTWTRDSDFSHLTCYHTDITPPTNAIVMFVEPIRGTGAEDLTNTQPSGTSIFVDTWKELPGSPGDGEVITSVTRGDFVSVPMLQTSSNDSNFLVGKTSSGEIAVAIFGDDEPDERGVKVSFLLTSVGTSASDSSGSGRTSAGSSTFTGLTDTPDELTADKWLKVNSAGDAIVEVNAPAGGEGAVADFLDLGDVPDSYTGLGGRVVAVNSGEDGLEAISIDDFGSSDYAVEEYDPNETYTVGRFVYTGTGDLKVLWFAADADHFNINSPSTTATVATTGWSRASEFKSYRGNFPSSSTYYHQGDWGYLLESGSNVYYVSRGSGFFTRAQIPTAQQWDRLTGATDATSAGWTVSATAPSNPDLGDGWYDTSDANDRLLKIWNGAVWEEVGIEEGATVWRGETVVWR